MTSKVNICFVTITFPFSGVCSTLISIVCVPKPSVYFGIIKFKGLIEFPFTLGISTSSFNTYHDILELVIVVAVLLQLDTVTLPVNSISR